MCDSPQLIHPESLTKCSMNILQDENVVGHAQWLLGKFLVSDIQGAICIGRIVETEAYRGPEDAASHAFQGRRTPRTKTMYLAAGHAYVYLCYGIHRLFNIVTGPIDMPHAVLIRAIEPVWGLEIIRDRRGLSQYSVRLGNGPGLLTQALGIDLLHDGLDLSHPVSPVYVAENKSDAPPVVSIGTRVGVSYAGEWAKRPWRFSIAKNQWVSKGKGS
jgi:DNA-3-methyladenine glycosylase